MVMALLYWWRGSPGSSTAGVSNTFLQYGALGACTLVACWLAFLLLRRQFSSGDEQIKQLEELLEQAQSRGDRLEAELANLNREVRTSMVGTLQSNTGLLDAAHRALEDQRRINIDQTREIEYLRTRLNNQS